MSFTKNCSKVVSHAFYLCAAVLILTGNNVSFAEDSCAWAKQPDGTTWGTCVDDSGVTYCVSCPPGATAGSCSRVSCADGKSTSNNPPSQGVLESAITGFYNNRGEWAGVFRIGRIEKIRLETVSDTVTIAHVRYFYTPIAGNYKGRTDTGYDQRTFVFNKNGPIWDVVSMGGYMSASF